jgi:hypothetical protein
MLQKLYFQVQMFRFSFIFAMGWDYVSVEL